MPPLNLLAVLTVVWVATAVGCGDRSGPSKDTTAGELLEQAVTETEMEQELEKLEKQINAPDEELP